MPEVLLFVFLIALLWFWLDSARAREIATELAKLVCQRESVQFLDGTVALRRLRMCQGNEGKRIERIFIFEYTDDAEIRRQGYVQTCGRTVTDVSFGLYTG